MASQLLLLELNEVNFDFVETYVAAGHLPVLGAMMRRHGVSRTTSENTYERLEPWIQWVTAHTGKSFDEHRVFRLGDIVQHDIPQIWETLEDRGMTVGAISPMNAKHRARSPVFFVPDPWTVTGITGDATLRRLYAALVQAVNDNAQAKVDFSSIVGLINGIARYALPENYLQYVKLCLTSFAGSWRRAIFLDLLLADVFVREVRRTRPNFASLFLNAAAHIQHHYMFSAAAYKGQRRNPEWYIKDGLDPVLEAYSAYDRIVGQIARTFPDARLMLATGLHQVPHEDATFYWRLKDHAKFLRHIGIPFERVEPRMSRDFLVVCSDAAHAEQSAKLLESVVHEDGTPLFEIENRGRDLFVTLSYPREIRPASRFTVQDRVFDCLHENVAFVALKNGEHNGIGYFLDTGNHAASSTVFPLKEVPQRIMEALGLEVLPTDRRRVGTRAQTEHPSRSRETGLSVQTRG